MRSPAPERSGEVSAAARLAVATLLAAAGSALGCAADPAPPLAEAPPFRLPALTGGDSLSLEDFRGQVVLLNFWASWCGPCREEIPVLLSIQRRYRDAGVTVLGVTVNDPPEDSRSFAREYGVDYPNVIGDDDLYDAYRLSPWIPASLLLDRRGRIVRQWIGPQTEETFRDGLLEADPDLEG
jgi:thiol-disulfide isomerase/thioredoxin